MAGLYPGPPVRRRRSTFWTTAPIALVALLVGVLWGGHPQWVPDPLRAVLVDEGVSTREQLIDEVQANFYKPVSDEKLEAESLKGIVRSLDDRFSEYYTPAEAKHVTQSLRSARTPT
jgi:hypothetical protein